MVRSPPFTWQRLFSCVRLLSLFLASEKVKVLNHPPYSPDLGPFDFFLFPRLKKMFSGNKYTSRSSLDSACYLSVSPTDTKRRLFICFSQLGKTVTKMCFCKGGILWRFVIKICLKKCSTEVIRTQRQNLLQDPRKKRQKKPKTTFLCETRRPAAEAFDIWYVATSRRHLSALFKLWRWGQNDCVQEGICLT